MLFRSETQLRIKLLVLFVS